MIKTLKLREKNFEKILNSFLTSRRGYSSKKITVVKKILNDVQMHGDKSLIKYEKKFNNLKTLKNNNLTFTKSEIKKSIKFLDRKVKNSIDLAYSRIFNFHKNQKFHKFKKKDKINNSFYYRSKPVEKVGVYVPGGKASYPSSVLMNCIPASIAGVNEIFMTVPSFDGGINPGVLYAAKKCGVKKIFKLGGAQAIAAFAFGTKVVPKVDKIVGPGNEYVALAKKEVSGISGIDMFAGPSEVTVIADKFSEPEWVSADLIAQSEHDEMSQSILVTNSKDLILKVNKSIKKQLKFLPKRMIASKSLKNFGLAIFANSESRILEVINTIAPEHLEIQTKNLQWFHDRLKNYGSLFIGEETTVAYGDKCSGTNHILPTKGAGKYTGGLFVGKFIKTLSFQRMTKESTKEVGAACARISRYEGMEAHARTGDVRLRKYGFQN